MNLVNLCQPGVKPVPTGDRCTGQCCKSFPLPFSWNEWAAMVITGEYLARFEGYHRRTGELAMILSMVRPNQNDPRNRPGQQQYYTCTMFDGKSCTAYDARPRMCSEYPYDNPCEHGLLCASKDARAGRVGKRKHLPIL